MNPLPIYKDILRAYWRWAPQLLILAVIIFIPVGLIHALPMELDVKELSFAGWFQIFAVIIAVLALAITGLLGEVFYTGVVTVSFAHRGEGVPALGKIARELAYGRLIAIDLIYGVVVAIGLILLVVPGLGAFVWFALAAPLVEMENRGVREAFRRSFDLIRGRFWLVFLILFPIEVVSEGFSELAHHASEAWLGHNIWAAWLSEVVSSVAVTPFFAVAAVLLTIRLIREKEGDGLPANTSQLR